MKSKELSIHEGRVMQKDEQNIKVSTRERPNPKNNLTLDATSLVNYIKREFKGLFSKEEIEKASDINSYYQDNQLAADVFKAKYLAPDETGPLHLWHRVARAIASVEEDKKFWYKEYFKILFDFKFLPGGRIMHGAGREDARRRPTLSNCYVIPIEEDSLEGIYQCLTESALVYRTGGGVGTDLSILRPEGAPVNATVDSSPGATAFMNLFSESTNAVSQAGRRGALMLTLRVDHPDVEKFITIKNDPLRQKVKYANISVLLTHEFMEAVLKDKDFDLRWPCIPGQKAEQPVKVYKTVRARDLWRKIIENAHASAEPGIIFWDTMRDYHNVEYAAPLCSTNPCGEQPLAAYTACNLGNLNLTKFVKEDGTFDFEELAKVTRIATRFMDDVIDYNMENHALEKIKKAVAADRRVGIGITGLADAFVLMKIKYDSEEALQMAEKIMRTIRDACYEASIELAKEKGAFPLFDWRGYSQSKFVKSLPKQLKEQIKKHGIRNSTLLTVPPVGTGSIVAETTSGIEPIFCTSYKRRVKNPDGETFREYTVYHPLVKKLFGNDENLPEYVVTAHQIDPYFRVKMQGVIQKYVDSSISSTVNLPEDVSVETVANIYITAYKAGLKGITVYREGSREGILQTEKSARAETPLGIGGRRPRTRPKITKGMTERIRTGEGNLYVTINEDDYGVCEVFSTIGKAGGNAAAQTEAISRLISLALRSYIDPMEIIEQLKGISGPAPVWENGELILSTPDAIGKALERYLIRTGKIKKSEPKKEGTPTKSTLYTERNGQPASTIEGESKSTPSIVPVTSNGGFTTCPDCGATLTHETGCVVCYHCGWSKC
ncbi:MAG: adenosylcobalamin-dependent ribonucleoside-diphosphate reductase [Calditrichaeota bacterium]|nr:MAG: adenosylcobalamin-dependent ribonucleoside-diphosphate reductase [Calditrichota bacterium]